MRALVKIQLLMMLLSSSLFETSAFACAVCGTAKEESRVAFMVTTIIMTVVPLIAIGFVVHYIYRQVKARETVLEEKLPA